MKIKPVKKNSKKFFCSHLIQLLMFILALKLSLYNQRDLSTLSFLLYLFSFVFTSSELIEMLNWN